MGPWHLCSSCLVLCPPQLLMFLLSLCFAELVMEIVKGVDIVVSYFAAANTVDEQVKRQIWAKLQ